MRWLRGPWGLLKSDFKVVKIHVTVKPREAGRWVARVASAATVTTPALKTLLPPGRGLCTHRAATPRLLAASVLPARSVAACERPRVCLAYLTRPPVFGVRPWAAGVPLRSSRGRVLPGGTDRPRAVYLPPTPVGVARPARAVSACAPASSVLPLLGLEVLSQTSSRRLRLDRGFET